MYRYKNKVEPWSRAPKKVCIIKHQHGAVYKFWYPSICEAARCLGVSKEAVWSAFYNQHKCQTFQVSMEPKRGYDLDKFINYEK